MFLHPTATTTRRSHGGSRATPRSATRRRARLTRHCWPWQPGPRTTSSTSTSPRRSSHWRRATTTTPSVTTRFPPSWPPSTTPYSSTLWRSRKVCRISRARSTWTRLTSPDACGEEASRVRYHISLISWRSKSSRIFHTRAKITLASISMEKIFLNKILGYNFLHSFREVARLIDIS